MRVKVVAWTLGAALLLLAGLQIAVAQAENRSERAGLDADYERTANEVQRVLWTGRWEK